MADEFVPYPEAQNDPNTYEWTDEERQQIEKHIAKYPEKRSAIMPLLWMAQEKWGWLPQKAIQLVADTLDESYAHVYGVSTFYTMYLKENKAPNLIEICTCFSCTVTGGPECYEKIKQRLDCDENGVSADGKYYVREAECLGSCDTAPMGQINNRRYVHNIDDDKIEEIIATLDKGEELPYHQIPLVDQSVYKQ